MANDPDTYAVVMSGEIGGTGGKAAGALISQGKGTAAGKIAALRECGLKVAGTPERIFEMLIEAVKEKEFRRNTF